MAKKQSETPVGDPAMLLKQWKKVRDPEEYQRTEQQQQEPRRDRARQQSINEIRIIAMLSELFDSE